MEEISVIIRTLLKHWLKLIGLSVFAMIAVFWLTKDQPQRFKSEAKIFLNFQENKAISLGDSEMKQYQILTYFHNAMQLVKAEKTINRVQWQVVHDALDTVGIFCDGNEPLLLRRARVEQRLSELAVENYHFQVDHPIDSMLLAYLDYHRLTYERLTDLIEASRVMDSNFMKFAFTEEDPQKAYRLAVLILDAFIEENRQLAKSQIYGHKELVEKLVAEAKKDLDVKIKRLEAYKVQHSIINLGEHTKAIVTYLVKLEEQRGKQMGIIAAGEKGRLEVLSTIKQGNELSVDLTTNEEIMKLKDQARVLVRQKMLASFQHRNLDSIAAVEAAIRETKQRIDTKLIELAKNTPYDPSRIQLELANRYLAYDLDKEIASAVIAALDEEIARAQTYSKRFAPYESMIGTMDQEISTAQNVYLQLLNKLNLTKALEYGSGENVIEIVDPPSRPTQPLPSKRIVIVAASGVAIFVLFAGIVIILHLLDASVSTVKRFERESKLKVVAAIPAQIAKEKAGLFNQSVALVHRQQVIHLAKAIMRSASPAENIVVFLSSQKEASLYSLARQVQRVASSDTKRIAVVNADWTSVCDDDAEAIIDIRELLADGTILINEESIITQMKALSSEYDLVLVVPPPTNLVADYRFWAEQYSKVVFVFRANRIWTKVDSRLEQYLANPDIELIGAAINQIDLEAMEDYIGDIPKPRNRFRIFIKKVLRRDFRE